MDAFCRHFIQLKTLFDEVELFEDFMLVFANNLLRDSIYGTMWRVSIGAALSLLDAVTDLYVIGTYYREGLNDKAGTMVSMITFNMVFQIVIVLGQYRKKSWKVKVKEILICLFLLRAPVDAYRVSTNYIDEDVAVNPLKEMIFNKVRNLFRVSVRQPGFSSGYFLVPFRPILIC